MTLRYAVIKSFASLSGSVNLGVLYSSTYNKEWLNIARKSSKEMDIDVIGKQIRKPEDIEPALIKLLQEVDVLWLTPDPIVLQKVESVIKVFKLCESMSKPVFTYDKAFVNIGATLILSADIPTIGRQAAGLLSDILANRKIAERIQNPAGSHIILNLNTDALDSVNEIIR